MTQAPEQELVNPFDEWIERYGEHQGGQGIILFVWEQCLGDLPDATLDPWQLDALFAFGEGERQISIRACHGPGKTAVAAWCVLYSLLFRHPLRAVATAPSRGQVEGALMSELAKWHQKLPPALAALIDIKATSATHVANPKTINFIARTARPENPEALQGVHEDEGWVFLLVDEASGVHEKIFESAAGSMSGHNCQTMLLSNPTRTSGFFFNTHNKESSRWYCIKIGWEDSSRVTETFEEEMALRYGRDSNVYRVRVLGEFPRADLDALIPYELVQSALERHIVVPPYLRPVWGVDVARFGDDHSALIIRNRLEVSPEIYVWQELDTMQLAGRVKALYDAKPDVEKPSSILVDVIGIGAGVVDRLMELGLPVHGVNVSESASLKDQYRNLRTELWFEARDWLASRDHRLPKCPEDGPHRCADRQDCVHERLADELTTIKYDVTGTGKLLAEPKSEMKKRGFKSPDIADAFILTFADEAALMIHSVDDGFGGDFAWNKPLSRNRSFV